MSLGLISVGRDITISRSIPIWPVVAKPVGEPSLSLGGKNVCKISSAWRYEYRLSPRSWGKAHQQSSNHNLVRGCSFQSRCPPPSRIQEWMAATLLAQGEWAFQ